MNKEYPYFQEKYIHEDCADFEEFQRIIVGGMDVKHGLTQDLPLR